jgi:glycosyltransferase involved in cell wall biosynthesis
MKILVLTWEFPPRIVGGIARHVAELYPEVHHLGHEIHLLTVQFGDALPQERVDGIEVHRITVGEGQNFLQWIGRMNEALGKYGGDLVMAHHECIKPFDLIHAHDWLVADAAIALKNRFQLPLIATIHATEQGRNNGIHTDLQRYVHQKEAWLIYESWRVIVCTHYMKRELQRMFQTPADKLDVIFNGIYQEKKRIDPTIDRVAFRRRFADDDEKIIYYVGRITYEKGIRQLLDASPQVIHALERKVKVVLIGGGNTEPLKEQARDLGISDRCVFTGFMPDHELDQFQTIADCAVFPSLYEPFGIVALESFAARVPVVVSDTGGMPEVVQHGKTGVVTRVNNPDSIAWGILEILKNPDYSRMLVENAYADLQVRFQWSQLAVETASVYSHVIQERSQVEW